MSNRKELFAFLMIVGAFLGACTGDSEQVETIQATKVTPTQVETIQATKVTPTQVETIQATKVIPTIEPSSTPDTTALPERSGSRQQTSGTVPHVQLDLEPSTAVNDELFRRAFLLPGVEERETIVSLPGASGMWLADGVPVVNPQAIVNGREFAHIHPDGSLHAPLPFERALEVAEKGWGERHPWADQRDGWEGFVMLYTPLTMDELDITFQLIVESYNHVTGRSIQVTDIP